MGKTKPIKPVAGGVPAGLDAQPLAFLVAPLSLDKFLEDQWEKAPVHIKATPERKSFFNNMMNMHELLELAKMRDQDEHDGPLLFPRDVNAVRYVNGVRESLNGEVASEAVLTDLFSQDCTFQVHQPQRIHDNLWRLLAALEAHLGCLVGSNSYITAPKSQGLAPHHDDVEIFVCQTSGSKRWRLYKPLAGFELPNKVSGDLPEEIIGEPVMEVTLQVGDVLYMPRGTVHQAVACEDGSSHLTISTYQRWSLGDLAQHIISVSADGQHNAEGACWPLALRKGLPIGFLQDCGLMADVGAGSTNQRSVDVATSVAAGLRALADQLEAMPQQLISMAADSIAADFIKSRLPAHPDQLPKKGPCPTLDDSLVCRGKGLFSIIPVPDDATTHSHDDDEDEEEEDGEGFVVVTTSLFNDRASHLMGHPHVDSDAEDEESDEEGEDDDDEEEEEEEGSDDEKKGAKKHGHKHHHHHHHDGSCGHHHHSDDEDEDGEDDSSDDDDDEKPTLPGPVVPASYTPAIAAVLSAFEAPGVKVRDLVALVPHKDETEALNLVNMLWTEGFACTIVGGGAPGKAEVDKKPVKAAAGKAEAAKKPVKAAAGKAEAAKKPVKAAADKAEAAKKPGKAAAVKADDDSKPAVKEGAPAKTNNKKAGAAKAGAAVKAEEKEEAAQGAQGKRGQKRGAAATTAAAEEAADVKADEPAAKKTRGGKAAAAAEPAATKAAAPKPAAAKPAAAKAAAPKPAAAKPAAGAGKGKGKKGK